MTYCYCIQGVPKSAPLNNDLLKYENNKIEINMNIIMSNNLLCVSGFLSGEFVSFR